MPFKNPTLFNRRLLTRLFSKIKVSTQFFYNGDPCWEWTACKSKNGYGKFGYNCQMRHAHTVTYRLFVGDIPDGLDCDHLCRHRFCVHPAHLEAVTPRINSLRGTSPWAENARKTHCKNGHEFTPENTYYTPNAVKKMRQCLICMRSRALIRETARQNALRQLPYDHPDRVSFRQTKNAQARKRRAKRKLLLQESHP